jgi:hypothetical protein
VGGKSAVLVHNVDRCKLYPNKYPKDLAGELALAERLGVKVTSPGNAAFDEAIATGRVRWAVLKGRQTGGHAEVGPGSGDQALRAQRGRPGARGGPGRDRGSNGHYIGLEIDGQSGHFFDAGWDGQGHRHGLLRASGDRLPVTAPYELAALDVRELVAALPGRLPGPESLEPQEWLYVIGMLATRIIEAAERLGPDDWTAASRAELHALATAESAGAIDHTEHVVRRLNLTAALLDRVAADQEVAIRNPREALALLFDELPASVEEARRLASHWRDLERAEILRLRIAKNLLTPALAINKRVRDPRLDVWAEVFPLLP